MEFQALTWTSEDIDDSYVIKVFGKSNDGTSIYMTFPFTPFFFIEVPDRWNAADTINLKNCISDRIGKNTFKQIKNVTLQKKKKFYGFTNKKEFKFLRFVFFNKKTFTRLLYIFKKPIYVTGYPNKLHFNIYEANFDPMLRFCHVQDIQPASWIKIENFEQVDEKVSHCDLEIKVNYRDVLPSERENIAPFVQASFDIETYSPDGAFPDPSIEECYVIQIATTLQRYGETEPYKKHLISLKSCNQIDDVTLECYETEKEVLNAWARLLVDENVDIIIGYNIWKFDLSYMYKRAKLVDAYEFLDIGRLKYSQATLREAHFSSSAYGDNDYEMLDIPGIFQIDLLVIMQREHKLTSYSLNNVAEHFLKEKKIDMPYLEMFKKFKMGPEERREIGEYCVQDTHLPLRLCNELAILPNMIEMAKATWVPISFLIERGQGIKVFSQILQSTRKNDMLVITLDKNQNKESEVYEGATVLDAMKGAYMETPITGLDFASLYPTIMIAHNLCHSTLVIENEYDNLPSVDYFEFSGYKFAQNVQGILPQMLQNLAKNRKQAKKAMANTTDKFMKAVYNGKQLAFKVSMNSIYGFCGASVGALPCKPVASCTTGIGRTMIDKTKRLVEEWYPGSTVVYGDSVTGCTPVILMRNNEIWIERIDAICKDFEHHEDKESCEIYGIKVWTETGWTSIHRIIRHKIDKEIYRVGTKHGMVDVTEDHSLLKINSEPITPIEVNIGDELLHSIPDDLTTLRCIPFNDACQFTNKVLALKKYLYLKKSGQNPEIDYTKDGYEINSSDDDTIDNKIIFKKKLGKTTRYVYDLTTENHHFHAGIGELIVHNTDSVMVKFNVGDLTGQDAIDKSFDLGTEAADKISETFKKPIELEFEKVYSPYLLFSKKRYAGLMYEKKENPSYIDAKGIQLVRRDNCKFVREVSQEVLNVIMYEKDLQKAKNIVIEHAKKLVEGKIDIHNLTVSKSLKRVSYEHIDGEVVMEHGYKMASQPHLTVAKKLETRMPGTGPKSGERVPYVFIETENPKDQQFKKAEDPEYAKANSLKLDIKYYLEHALMSPLESLFELFLENPKEELFGQFIPPKKKRERKKIQIVI